MNLNKDPSSWARVVPRSVLLGTPYQAENVLDMAIKDIGKQAAEIERLRWALSKIARKYPCETVDDMAGIAKEALGI